MKLLNLLISDLKRAIWSRTFVFSVLGAALFMILDVAYGLPSHGSKEAVLMTLGAFGGYATVGTHILPCVPFASSFAKEWSDHSYLFYTARAGVTRYMLSKLVVSFVSAFLVALLGMELTVVFVHFGTDNPMWDPLNGLYAGLFTSEFFASGHTFLGYFLFCCNRALTICIHAIVAVLFSTYIPNALATLAAPLIIGQTLAQVNGIFYDKHGHHYLTDTFLGKFGDVLSYLDWNEHGTVGEVFGNRFLMTGIACLFLGFWAIRRAKRRILNG